MRPWRNWQTRRIWATLLQWSFYCGCRAGKIMVKNLICGYGGTGRRTRFRFWRRDPCRFDSCYPHQTAQTRTTRCSCISSRKQSPWCSDLRKQGKTKSPLRTTEAGFLFYSIIEIAKGKFVSKIAFTRF